MSKLHWPFVVLLCLPSFAAAKKYSPAHWVQFADAGFSSMDLQTLPKETITIGTKAAAAGKTRKSKKHAKKKSKKSGASKQPAGGSPLSIRYNF